MVIDRESWEKMQNDVEMIKARVSSLDRIAVLESKQLIIDDLKEIIGRSTYMAAVLHLTLEPVQRQQLAEAIGTHENNLNKWTGPLTGKKGYLYHFKHDGRVYFQRDEKVDLIDFDNIEPFASLIKEWLEHKT